MHTHVALFGRVRVTTGDRVLDDRAFPSRKAKQVFTLLALAQGAAVSKEHLVEVIWGDRLPRNPMATLEHTVSILRSTCFNASPSSIIVTVNGGYRLDTSVASVDTLRFDQLVRASSHATPPHALQLLCDALALAHGDLLEDEPSAEWAMSARHDYRSRIERAALEAARIALMEDEPELAVGLADRAQALALLPSEDAYHLQASARIRLGRRADALLLLREAERALEREFGSTLPPATVALREMLRSPLTAVAQPSSLVLDLAPVGAPRVPSLIGRTVELRSAEATVAHVAAGGSALLLVEGPAGIGKTRLLDELAQVATGVRIVRLGCTLPGQALPRFVAARLHRALAAAAGVHKHVPEPPSGLDAATTLYEQLATVIAAAGPTVVLLDDLHWADDESRTIIAGLAGPDGSAGFGVVAASRPGGSDHADRRALRATRLVLGPLSAAELATAGWSVDHRDAGGIPLVVMAALEQHREGRIATATIDALLARTVEPGPLAHEVLLVVAAVGRVTSAAEIAFVLGIAPDIVRALTDRLERHRLVRREGEHVDLADEVTRQVLRAVMGADRVRSIRSTLGQVPNGTSLAASADAG